MSTLLMAMLIIALTVILPWIFISQHKRTQQKKARENFRRFSNAGSERDLSFSRQDIIQNKIIGFDGIRQVIMMIEMENDYDITCIPVKELMHCTINKVYITTGETPEEKEKLLKEINLLFSFADGRMPVSIPFYSNTNDSIYLMADMEAKAKDWQTAISRMIPKNTVLQQQ